MNIQSSAGCAIALPRSVFAGMMSFMIKVMRVIDRLNIGGPAIHVTLVSEALDKSKFETLLVYGRIESHEGSMEYLPAERGIRTKMVSGLGRSVSPLRDLGALWRLYWLMRRERPDIVHTHKAKAGALGRLAAWLARVPVIVHTFHGHVFSGYFSPWKSRLVMAAERIFSRLADRIIVLSEAQRGDICEVYRIAKPVKVSIIPLGFDLSRFHDSFVSQEQRKRDARQELSMSKDAPVVGIVGRLAPVKNHQLFFSAAKEVLEHLPMTQFVVVGDGELRDRLTVCVRELGIEKNVHFLGWMHHMERVYPAFDVAALTSVNEGTPVTLIEAMACGVPVVATHVGGVPDVLGYGKFGSLVPSGDAGVFAKELLSILSGKVCVKERTAAARIHVLQTYSADRLVSDLEDLYRLLLND